MPYTKMADRSRAYVSVGEAEKTGDLTFQLYTIACRYLLKHGLSYQTLAEAKIALLDALLEIQSQLVVPYESVKQRDNGDVAEAAVLKHMIQEMSG